MKVSQVDGGTINWYLEQAGRNFRQHFQALGWQNQSWLDKNRNADPAVSETEHFLLCFLNKNQELDVSCVHHTASKHLQNGLLDSNK